MIDDQVANATLVTEALREVGSQLHVHHAENAAHGLMFLAGNGEYRGAPTPHLILLDINMPGMSGLDLLVALKASEWASIPVIMLTSSTREIERSESLERGAIAFWTKATTFEGHCKMAAIIQAWEAGERSFESLPRILSFAE